MLTNEPYCKVMLVFQVTKKAILKQLQPLGVNWTAKMVCLHFKTHQPPLTNDQELDTCDSYLVFYRGFWKGSLIG